MALSATYNIRKNHWIQINDDYQALTINDSLFLSEKTRIFCRFDNVSSLKSGTETDPWYPTRVGQLYLLGLQYSPAPGVNISPNYQGWQPSGSGESLVSAIFLSLDLKF